MKTPHTQVHRRVRLDTDPDAEGNLEQRDNQPLVKNRQNEVFPRKYQSSVFVSKLGIVSAVLLKDFVSGSRQVSISYLQSRVMSIYK